jgi:hypothetical protein
MAKTEKLTDTLTHMLSALIGRKGKGVIDAPSGSQSPLNGDVLDADFSRPFLKRPRLAPKGYVQTVASVAGLLKGGSPFAVVGRVISVIVFTLKAHPFGAFSHIRKECLKRFHPLVAHLNTSTAVPTEAWSVGVIASLPNPLPNTVLGRVVMSVLADLFGVQTPAGLAETASERISVNRLFRSAFAATSPHSVTAFAVASEHPCQYDPSTESIARQVSIVRGMFHTSILTLRPAFMGVKS